MKRIFTLCGLFLFNFNQLTAQLTVDNTTQSPIDLVTNVLIGSGITVSNITYNGSAATALIPQTSLGEFTGTSSIGLAGGLIMATGNAQACIGPNTVGSYSLGSTGGGGSDPDLNAICSATIFDQAVLEFDFIPTGDSIKFRYAFGSDEYLEFVASGYNDAFGFFLSGPGIAGPYSLGAINIATVPGTSTPCSIDNINTTVNPAYYVNNPASAGSTATIQYDGYTVVMIAKAKVQCGQLYHIKLGIADAGDGAWDSGVFLEGGSFSSTGVQIGLETTSGTNSIMEGCLQGGTYTFVRAECDTDDTLEIPIYVTGSAINGSDYSPFIDSLVTFLPGEDSVSFSFLAINDGLTEGADSLIITVYNVDAFGDTTVSQTVVFIVDQVPMQVGIGNDTSLACLGGIVPLSSTVTGGFLPYTYIWSVGGSTPSINPMITSTQDIILTVNGICGTTDSDTMTVTVAPIIPQIWTSQSFSTICPFDPIDISAFYVSGGTAPFTYAWNTGPLTASINVSPGVSTNYSITIGDACAQDTTIVIPVSVANYPPLVVTATGDELCLNTNGQIAVPVSVTGGAGGYSFLWTGPIGTTVLHIPSESVGLATNPLGGLYSVFVTDACGVMAFDTATVEVTPCDITIPNIVTPNGDNMNDIFFITNLDYHPNSIVMIFNRWGQVMYENSNYQNDYRPNDLTDGVYFYVVKLTDGTVPADYNGTLQVATH